MSGKKEKNRPANFRLPFKLVAKLDELASRFGKTRTALVKGMLECWVVAAESPGFVATVNPKLFGHELQLKGAYLSAVERLASAKQNPLTRFEEASLFEHLHSLHLVYLRGMAFVQMAEEEQTPPPQEG